MAYKWFILLTTAQQEEAMALRPKWKPEDFQNFEFWLRPDGHVSRRSGHHQLTEPATEAMFRGIAGETVRSKGDNREWKPGVTYHFVRD